MDQGRSRTAVTLLMLLAAVVFGMVIAGSLQLTASSSASPEPSLAYEEGGDDGEGQDAASRLALSPRIEMPSFADLAEAVLPAVVSVRVTTIAAASDEAGDPRNFMDRFFRQEPRDRGGRETPEEFRSDGSGSGFVISPDGWVVTNYHVIDEATSVLVRLDGREFEAEVHGEDPTTDLALLKIDAGRSLDYLSLGDSSELRVGEWVMAIGNPLRLESSVTVGVVSATGRSGFQLADNSFEDFIQTDAAINRGNSGGPLVNVHGEVVGIATAMNFGAENIGFAVPVDTLRTILPQLQSEGRVRRGYLGVAVNNIDYETMQAFRLSSTDGALIASVVEGSPGAKGGLRHGDVILKVDSHDVAATRDLIDFVSAKQPGTTVELELLRGSDVIRRKVELTERPTEEVAVQLPEQEPTPTELEWLGLQYEDLTPEIRSSLEVPRDVEGVVVSDVAASSPVWGELQRGDVIVEVNGRPVGSATELEELLGGLDSGGFVRMYVRGPGGGYRFAILRLP